MDFMNEMTIAELVEVCRVISNMNVKQTLLIKIGQQLSNENFISLDQRLTQEIKDIYGQIYGNEFLNRIFIQQPSSTIIDSEQLLRNQGAIESNSSSSLRPNVIEILEPSGLSSNSRGPQAEVTDNQEGGGSISHRELARKRSASKSRSITEICTSEEELDEVVAEEEMLEDDSDLDLPHKRYNNISIISNNSIFNNKFKINSAVTTFKFKNIPNQSSKLPSFLKKAFNEMLSYITRNALPHHKIGMKISLNNFNATKSFGVNFIDVSQIKADVIAPFFESVPNFQLIESFEITSVLLQVLHGKGRINISHTPSKDLILFNVKSLIDIRVDSQFYCLPIAIIVGQCLADRQSNKITIYKKNKEKLMEDIHLLNKQAGIKTSKNFGSSIVQMTLYQKILPTYNIVVFNNKENFKDKLFVGNNNTDGKDINIFYFEDISHFVALRDVRKFFNKPYQCGLCSELYVVKTNHVCTVKCRSCEISPPCKRKIEKINCDACMRYFYGQQCFDNHKTTVCNNLKFCFMCAKLVDKRNQEFTEHSCEDKKCTICLKIVNSSHECYVQKYEENLPTKFSIIFYNFVCTQSLLIDNETFVREPNLCVAHIVCNNCFMVPNIDFYCYTCEKRQHVFENSLDSNCVKKFVDFCEVDRKNCLIVFCIEHNFKANDGQYILHELMKREKSVEPIMGDSLNFLPIPLSKFPETFDLKHLVTKGWYPHFFNTNANYNYVGDVPNKKYFGPSIMSGKELELFNSWYVERIGSPLQYDNREELIGYCVKDVNILRNGCIAFMTNFSKITSINPLFQSFTLAQAVMHAYRKEFLTENTLGILPSSLYHKSNKNQSHISLKWLINENKKCSGKIVYEFKIPDTNFYVDGFCQSTNTVYEFLDCYRQGCKNCFLNRTQHLNGSTDSFECRYDQTSLRLHFIVSLGYKIVQIWECEFKELLKKNSKISKTLNHEHEILYKYLNPRDAVYYPRSECFQLHYKAKHGEKIRYYKFSSLYPYVNKTCKTPIHHPKIHYMDECKKLDILNIDGLIKCSILPPNDLLIPILPCKINGKLLFILCRTCAEKVNTSTTCTHNKTERMLIGTWVLDEVKLALNNRYKIVKIFEVWEYETSQYDEKEKTGGVFTDFINCFQKLEQEARDWPANITSETERTEYINNLFDHEGIRLDPTAIMHNPSQLAFSKLALNAFCGKLFQKSDSSHTGIIHSLLELYNLISSPGIELIDVIPVEDVLWVNWKYSNDPFENPLKNISLTIKAFTTANARIKLYTELAKISNNLLYCDTDSIIFVEDDNNQGMLKTGRFIGDLTDELSAYGPNSYITEFVSTGAKSFAYIVLNPDNNKSFEIATCNGITLSIKLNNLLNICSLQSFLIEEEDEEFRVVQDKQKIKRKKMLKVSRKS